MTDIGRSIVDRLDDGKDPSPLTQWMVHHPLIMTGLYVTGELFKLAVKDSLSTWGYLTLNVLLLVGFFYWMAAFIKHLFGFCTACANQPLGDEKIVEKHQFALQWFHYISEYLWRLVAAVLGLEVAARLLAGFLLGGETGGLVGNLLGIAIIASWVGMTQHSHHMHSWLRPWCPWCGNGGGGGEVAEVPDPDPSGVKTA